MALSLRIIPGLGICSVDALEYYEGEDVSFHVQIIDGNSDCECKYVIPEDITGLTLTLPGSDEDLVITDSDNISVNADDRSIVDITLDDTHTTDMISGWIKIEWDEDDVHRVAYSEFIQEKLSMGDS